MPTLDVNLDNVCRLIQLAEEFHAQEEVVIEDEPTSPVDDWPMQILARHASDSTMEEFRSIINDLDRCQQEQVVALLWLGRGDYEVDDWQALLRDVNDAWTPHTADYLIAHALLPTYLTDGLELLGYRCG
ncbi:MAG: DUF3775 domain-containing protein [Ectothiorhodospiraceae bacterium]|nr:DUF3775 domain-containing protein [Ectothiorhodospiraceae bacterium]MCH8506350.1 DUF3775 domain-containing protein [Ectothiorhodospiraceae bacterium]